MLRSVGLKTLYDQRRALIGWSLSFVLLVAMYAAIWPSMRDQPSMSDFLNQMPKAMRSLFAASGADLSTPVGYVQVELLAFLGPLLLIICAITAGASAIAGEEDRHTLDLLVANPVSRARIVMEKFGAMTAGTALIGAVTGIALLGEGALADMTLPAAGVAAAMVHMTLLALVFGTMALAISAATGHPALSRAIPAVVAVIAYVVNGLASVVSWLEPVQKFSPFYQYSGHDPLRHGLSWAAILVAVATIAVLTAIAVAAFRRRDMAA
jgi:beta-exotoxin I transport system permease protein